MNCRNDKRSATYRSLLRALSLRLLATVASTLPYTAQSGGFTSASDEASRHHWQFLADEGLSQGLVTTWPMHVGSIEASLQDIDPQALNSAQRRSFEFLSRIHHPDGINYATTAQYGNSREELRGFSSDFRESGEVRIVVEGSSENAFGALNLSAIDNPLDGQRHRLDESYIAADLGGWTVGAGRLSRWWGPGWQSSLILSTNARPTPGLFLSRARSDASELPVAKWLGPWHLNLFANQLESNRFVPDAKLIGARFTFKPNKALEIGLARTAQWGGEGRPETLDSLVDLLLGKDNVGTDGIDRDNEPGNQLGGIDWRWSFRAGGQTIIHYGQLIGEDEAGGLPSRKIGLFGFETPIVTENTHGRLYLEYSDTTMDFDDDRFFNSAYNHSVYQTGYRYRGRVLGASTDNDSRLLALGGYHQLPGKQSIAWKALYGELNRDGGNGNNTVAPTSIDTSMVSIEYRKQIDERWEAGLLGYYLTDEIAPGTDVSKEGIQLRFSWKQ